MKVLITYSLCLSPEMISRILSGTAAKSLHWVEWAMELHKIQHSRPLDFAAEIRNCLGESFSSWVVPNNENLLAETRLWLTKGA